ncbi:MAG: DUF1778 domain-containing protein [Myxococcota bacterium]
MTTTPTNGSNNEGDERTRMDVRMSERLKALVERAAALRYLKPAEFVREVLVEKAQQVIRETQVLELSERDTLRFFEALERGVKPSDPLLREAEEYRREIDEGKLDSR